MAMTGVGDFAQDQNSSSLLRLPRSIRHRIYSHVGLVPTGDYDLPYVFQLHGSNRPEFCRFHGLLLSCRTVYDEASELLYRANRFITRYGEHRSLAPLRNLRPVTLSNLTHLKVVLNEASCHSSEDPWEGFAERDIRHDHKVTAAVVDGIDPNARLQLSGHDIALSGSECDAKPLFDEWESTVAHLSSRISPDAVILSVVCDVFHQEVDTARRVLAPLRSLPLLRQCHLRLSNMPTPELNRLARDAALKACGISYPQHSQPDSCSSDGNSQPLTGSRLLTLPMELRLQILEHTDLVTPWREVIWCRKDHVFRASRAFCTTLDFSGEKCVAHDGCEFVDCWETYPKPSIGCFCRLKHSAFSSHCKCWVPPRSVLLVCRALYKEAHSVLFSQNRFVIHDHESNSPLSTPLGRYKHSRLAASVFLDEAVPRDCLGQLRCLEFVFPAYDHDSWPEEGQEALLDWRETINLVKWKLNLPALTVRLVMAFSSDWDLPGSSRRVSMAEGEAILAGYDRILSPLVQLGGEGGLAGFYTGFEWPWSRTENTIGDYRWDWMLAKKRELGERAERLVLGRDRYELQSSSGSSRGSAESVWVRRHARDC